jgi:hypothetical protein
MQNCKLKVCLRIRNTYFLIDFKMNMELEINYKYYEYELGPELGVKIRKDWSKKLDSFPFEP